MPAKKNIIIAISLLILIILSFVIFLLYRQKNSGNRDNSSVNTNIPNPIDILDKAVKEKNTGLCQKLSGDEANYCVSNVAMATEDMEICKKISDQAFRVKCTGLFALKKITEGQDAKKCSELADAELQKSCYTIFFRKFKDISLCLDLNGQARTDCQDSIFNLDAYKKNDEKLCNQIVSEGLKKECLDNLKNKPK